MRNYVVTITRVFLAGAAVLVNPDSTWSANPRSLSGVVQTGGTSSSQGLPNVPVSLFEATTGQPTVLGQATTEIGRASCRERVEITGGAGSCNKTKNRGDG